MKVEKTTVYLFKGKSEHYGLSIDRTGAKLPAELGPWAFSKTLQISPTDEGRVGLDVKQELGDIGKQGFHMTTVKISVSVQAGKEAPGAR